MEHIAIVGDGIGVVGTFMDIEQFIVRLCELLCMSEGLHFAIAEDKVA